MVPSSLALKLILFIEKAVSSKLVTRNQDIKSGQSNFVVGSQKSFEGLKFLVLILLQY